MAIGILCINDRFYLRHGFVQGEEAGWDIYYQRAPSNLTT